MRRDFDIVIVGAGPAGLAAAIEAKKCNSKAKVAVLEKMEKAGKKLSASGNGRGNLSNRSCHELDEVLNFFLESGIAIRADEAGRIYPYSEEAKAVTSALLKHAKRLGAEIFTDTKVSNVEADREGGFHIFIEKKQDTFYSKKLLIATGGKSFAVYGSSGDGFSMAKSFGHSVIPPVPGLTAVEVAESLGDLKGIRAKAEVSLLVGGQMVFREEGEVQFRDDSISGICVMNLSSKLPSSREELSGCKILINFVPDFDTMQLKNFISLQAKTPGNTMLDLLETIVKKPLAMRILKDTSIDGNQSTQELKGAKLVNLLNGLRCFTLSPCGRKGWKEAQVTRGGVTLEEIDYETMESKLVRGLYFAGEVTDYDGPCGGFNLHNAWLTGIKAGKDMAKGV